MENKTFNSGLIVALHLLGYDEVDELPKLEEVRRSFFESARNLHPDKNLNADSTIKEKKEEDFKKLLNAFKLATEFIITNSTGENTEMDSDSE